MSARYKEKNHRSAKWIIAYLFLMPTLSWVFLATIDGPATNIGIAAGGVSYKIGKVVDRAHAIQLQSLLVGVLPEERARVHSSFLLFDFKQNLRHWPNVAGDITRSPPFYWP